MPTCRLRRAASITDFLWILIIIALLISILLPSLSRARELAKRAVCAANQRGIGVGMVIYANDHTGATPSHYFEPTKSTEGSPEHGVLWVGAMGSNDFLRISQATSPKISPRRSHPSRSLFLNIIAGQSTPAMYICPSSADEADDLRNRGPDSSGAPESAAQPGLNRFDFRGYRRLSYGYQLPYGPKGVDPLDAPNRKPTRDVRLPMLADKSPYYTDGGAGLPGSGTTRDARAKLDPPAAWADLPAAELMRTTSEKWRPYNSRNHGGEGQNVMFVDSHVEFLKRPTVGIDQDNIYTLSSGGGANAGRIGRVPGALEAHGPITNTDTFIVP